MILFTGQDLVSKSQNEVETEQESTAGSQSEGRGGEA